jgi:hypothetical protein
MRLVDEGRRTEIVSVRVEDPDVPQVLASTTVIEPGAAGPAVALEPLGERMLILVASGEDEVTVMALAPQPDGSVQIRSRLSVPDVVPGTSAPWLRGAEFQPSPSAIVRQGYVYLGLTCELVTIDARSPEHLLEASRLRLEAADRFRPHSSRHLAIHDGRLHVARHWPGELVIVDLSDPASPRPRATDFARSPLMGARRLGDLLYTSPSRRRGVEVRDPDDLEARPVPVFLAGSGGEAWGMQMSGAPLIIDGQLLATMGDHLAVFELPQRLRPAALPE